MMSQKTFHIASGSAQQLYETDPLFALFFPVVETQTYLQQAVLLDQVTVTCSFTVDSDGDYQLQGEAKMTGMQKLVAEDILQPFSVNANFVNNELHGSFFVYIYDSGKLYQLEQMLYYYGRVLALLVISYSQVRLSFNSLVQQSILLQNILDVNNLHIENILQQYPELNVGTDWPTKLLFAEKLCQTLSLPSFSTSQFED
jgi:hypothetical protein